MPLRLDRGEGGEVGEGKGKKGSKEEGGDPYVRVRGSCFQLGQ